MPFLNCTRNRLCILVAALTTTQWFCTCSLNTIMRLFHPQIRSESFCFKCTHACCLTTHECQDQDGFVSSRCLFSALWLVLLYIFIFFAGFLRSIRCIMVNLLLHQCVSCLMLYGLSASPVKFFAVWTQVAKRYEDAASWRLLLCFGRSQFIR